MKSTRRASRLARDYGMLGVLLLLCLLFSILTVREQTPEGARAARSVLAAMRTAASPRTVIVACQPSREDSLFARVLTATLRERGVTRTVLLQAAPAGVREGLDALADSPGAGTAIVCTDALEPVVRAAAAGHPALASVPLFTPAPYRWPTFLLAENLRNVANQITVIAIIAIGMTMVIVSGGIDLSVGSLIALSAVVTAWIVARLGGEGASNAAILAGALGGLALAGASGAFGGLMITRFGIPPFIATLAMMQVAAGAAYIISRGKPIYQLPDRFILLGRGAAPLVGIPNAVILMVLLYVAAHLVMSRTTLGRHIYAVGGNPEAARLAGIRVHGVLFLVYTVSGVLAGLGGVLMASQLKSGAPTYGVTYELYVIAAVVVGGASLSGGEGRVLGTLIGALVIAVIQNGMNLTNVESYTQKVVLGLVILGAVLLDRLRQRGLGGPGGRHS